MNREDFNMLSNDIIYFDNAATTLKPKVLGEVISDYYNNYTSNIHRGDYDISLKAESMYENTRTKVANLINANNKEIVFTSGATDSLNKIIFGYFKDYLKEDDEVLTTRSEHASLILPFFELANTNKIKVNYIKLDDEYKVTLENVKNSITSKTKVIALAHITNVIGDIRPIKEIIESAHKNNILVIIDGAQSVPHIKIDVKDLDVDFLAFSAHKMLGPTGLGILYAKENLLENTKPIIFGGGMNASFEDTTDRVYSDIPNRLEAGTPNIAGVIGFGKVIDYINEITLDKINEYENSLKNYMIEQLEKNPNITIYNKNSDSGIITINYKDVFAQDLAIYLNKYNICVRAGNHCAKILKNEIGIKNTCRISLYFYNSKSEIDKFIEVINNPNLINEIL
ncbi:MAG TPA: cysteine desulfurase [Bacilli bacterium]|nr:cysteine desulfurase [Bacilli bacterium]